MSTEMTGISIEPHDATMWSLFEVRRIAAKEIEERAKQYMIALGYTWYRFESVSVDMIDRGKVQIVSISARGEDDFHPVSAGFEVPLRQFESMVKR